MTDDDGATPEEKMEEYDSGPFCQHWGDPFDCDETCVCGHTCGQHGGHDCCNECDCEEFREPGKPGE